MIIDDEKDAISYLTILIEETCPNIKVVATATSSEDAIKKYFRKLPDLLFLDVEVDEKNGFEILKEIYNDKLRPYTIFVTAFNQYAIEAFKANALDFLLKPYSPEDLKAAIKKFRDAREKEFRYEKIMALFEGEKQKIRFNSRTGFILFAPNEILYCEADRNYTKLFTAPDQFEVVSLNLAEVEKKLSKGRFWRISRSVLVNSDSVKEIDRKQKKVILKTPKGLLELKASNEMLKQL